VTFIIAEDEALKAQLQGVIVADNASQDRAVEVWFGQPDLQMREQKFPFITIDLVDISEARERVMVSNGVRPWYYSVTYPDLEELPDDWDMPYPIPINLDYQITTFARSPRHDRQILAQLLGTRIPFRFGALPVIEYEEIVGDTTQVYKSARRLDMLGHYKRDMVENNKKMYMNIFTVRVSSEIPNIKVARYFYQIDSISLTQKSSYPDALSSPDLITTITFTAPVS
jgi:hypothetical protein